MLLLCVAGATIMALVALGVAYNTSFQTWLARRVLSEQAGLKSSLGRLSVSLNRFSLDDLKLEHEGVLVVIPSLSAEISLLDALRRDFRVSRFSAKGVIVDLTRAMTQMGGTAGVPRDVLSTKTGSQPSPQSSQASQTETVQFQLADTARDFDGLFKRLQLPVDLSLDKADLEGEVVFVGRGNREPSVVRLTLSGGGLGQAREALFDFTMIAATKEDAPIARLGAKGVLTLSMNTPRTFDRLSTRIEADASGRQLPQGAKLTLAAKATHRGNGEVYELELGSGGRKLVEGRIDYQAGVGRLVGSWKLNLKDGEIAPFSMGVELPRFALHGSGDLNASVDGGDIQVNGSLAGEVDRLGVLHASLMEFGALSGGSEFDLAVRGRDLRVTRLRIEVDSAKPIVRIEALQGFEYGFDSGELRVADPSKDLVRLRLLGVPLSWGKPWLKDVELKGADISGVVCLGARNGGITLRGEEPIQIARLTVGSKESSWVKDMDLSILGIADYSAGGWQMHLQRVEASSEGNEVLSLEGRVGRLAGKNQSIKAEGKGHVRLAEAMQQPGIPKNFNLKSGRANFGFTASVGERQELQADLTVTELITKNDDAKALPELRASFRIDRAKDGILIIQAPVQFVEKEHGRVSDLTISGKVSFPQNAPLSMGVGVSSSFLAIEDLLAFSALLQQPGAPAITESAKAPRTPAADTSPFWSGVRGTVALALKRIRYQSQLEVSDVTGNLTIDDGALRIEDAKASLPQAAAVEVKTAVRFDVKAAEPYTLGGDIRIDDYKSDALLPKSASAPEPAIEAEFDIDARMEGSGRTMRDLVDQVRGSVTITSKGGTCRLLKTDVSDTVKPPQKVSSLVGNLGAMLGSDRLSNYASQAQTVSQISKTLSEITFDQLSMTVTRDPELNLRLLDLTLISPQLRLGGSGEIRHVQGLNLEAQPVDLRLQVGVRGELAQLMTKVGLLDGRQDNLGYQIFSAPVRIGGTLGQPENADLKSALVKAASGSLLNSLLKR